MSSSDLHYFLWGLVILFMIPCLFIAIKSIRKQTHAIAGQKQALDGQRQALFGQQQGLEAQAKALKQNAQMIALLTEISTKLDKR